MGGTGSRTIGLAECARIAAGQHGVIGLEQAMASGLSRSSIYRLAGAGGWRRIHPKVFRLWQPDTKVDRWLQRLSSAAVWLGERSAASHRAAGILWGLEGIRATPVELVTTSRRRASRPGLVLHRVQDIRDDDISKIKGIPVTTIGRTIVDLAAILPLSDLEVALESAVRQRLITPGAINDRLLRTGPTVAGRGALRSLLWAPPEVATDSALEVLVWRMLLKGGLPRPVRQYEVRDDAGRFVARVDFAYPEARLAIEADSYRFHSGRREWQRDRARQNRLSQLSWISYGVTWDDVKLRGPATCEDVARLLRARK